MDPRIFKQLHLDGLLSTDSLQKVEAVEKARLFSLLWELKTLLYLGVTLLSGGLGILIYQHLDTIGHQVILAVILFICAGCFYYCFRKALPFSAIKVPAPNAFYDYILLLGCLTLITFIAYLQFAYAVFGDHYGLVTFIPLLLLFFCAYRFDHLGVLSMAITNLAAWMGIAVTPRSILNDVGFGDPRIIYAGLALGAILLLAAAVSEKRQLKTHFAFTYTNFGTHILFISSLAGLFVYSVYYLLWFLLVLGIAYFTYRQAMKKRSFYFLLMLTLYGYVALSYVVINLLDKLGTDGTNALFLGLLYFILSGIALVRILMMANRKMKTHDSV